MISILRWWRNPDAANPNKLISRTLGKIAFIDNTFHGPEPQDGEFWFSSITVEIAAGQVKGCFLAEPFDKVNYEELVLLNRQNCTINPTEEGRCLVIDPVQLYVDEDRNSKSIPWILPLQFRSELQNPNIVSIVVNLGGEIWKKSRKVD